MVNSFASGVSKLKIGDIVTRKSYNNDVRFSIIGISVDSSGEIIAVLKALYQDNFLADAPLTDLQPVERSLE